MAPAILTVRSRRFSAASCAARAAAALSRAYPGGREAFIRAMNEKANSLGLQGTRFADSTGLSSTNVSTAEDLAILAPGWATLRVYGSTEPTGTVLDVLRAKHPDVGLVLGVWIEPETVRDSVRHAFVTDAPIAALYEHAADAAPTQLARQRKAHRAPTHDQHIQGINVLYYYIEYSLVMIIELLIL